MRCDNTALDFLWSGVVRPDPATRLEIRLVHPEGPARSLFLRREDFEQPQLRHQLLENLEAAEHEGYNIYFGVAPRRAVHGKFRGTKAHCLAPQCFFLDFDRVELNGQWRTEFDEIRSEHNLPEPTFIVNSGAGAHVYWALDRRPFRPQWETRQRKLVSLFPAADPAVKNIDRLLRVPGYLNPKHAHKPTCEIIEHNPQATASLKDFPVSTTADARREADGRSAFLRQATYGAGERDDFLFSYALRLWKKHLTKEEVELLTHHANENRCVPACPEEDVDEKIGNAHRFFRSKGKAIDNE